MRNSSGSAFAAAASSSMNDSDAKVDSRPFGSRRFPLRTADLLCDVRRLTAGIVGGGASEPLRSFHPNDAYLILRHTQKRCDAPAHPVGLHVIGIDRHLAVRWIRRGMRRTDRRVALERN